MKFLIVDDSSTMRRIICNSVKTIGECEIIEAGDGVEGLEAFNGNPGITMILTDWNMPNMNGLTFLEKVREIDKDVPIVMITTEAEKQNVVTAIKAGANNYIVKPFTPDVLKEKISPLL
ncbi:MAG: response regulator [Planctomycetota bacterium]|jgi:two-component system chemotaxis response regulator CheY